MALIQKCIIWGFLGGMAFGVVGGLLGWERAPEIGVGVAVFSVLMIVPLGLFRMVVSFFPGHGPVNIAPSTGRRITCPLCNGSGTWAVGTEGVGTAGELNRSLKACSRCNGSGIILQ